MRFGYFPDFKDKSFIKDLYLKIFGYPYAPRRNEVRLVFNLLKAQKGEKILDVGCGDGIFTNYLASKGVKVTGLDYSAHDIKLARKRAEILEVDATYVEADASKMPFDDNTFDAIYSISTFEHIKDDKKALCECKRVLKPGGRIVISVPTGRSFVTYSLFKFLFTLPLSIKKKLLNSRLVSANTLDEYQQLSDEKFAHFRKYPLNTLVNFSVAEGLKLTKYNYSAKYFGIVPYIILHSLVSFEWLKDTKSEYRFKSEKAHALFFPLSYLFFIADDFLKRDGFILIASFLKKS